MAIPDLGKPQWNKQMPGLGSITNIGGNFKAAFMTGYTGSSYYTDKNGVTRNRFSPIEGGFRGTLFNFNKDKETGQAYWNPGLSVGGTLSAGYGAVGGAATGAIGGAVLSNFLEGGNAIRGAVAGAAIGGAAIAATPFVAGAAARGAVNILKNSDKIFAGIGEGVINGASAIGAGVKNAASATMKAGYFGGAASAANPITRHLGGLAGFASKMVKENKGFNDDGIISDYSLSGLGKAVVFGGALIKGVKDAAKTYMNDKRGQIDPYITTMSPQIRLVDNAGATGDLIFALNNNRRG